MKTAGKDPDGAFVPGERFLLKPTGTGPLDGLRFTVKDLIDVAGRRTGGGNPDWLATAEPARAHAPVVGRLLQAGATLIGKTVTDELAFSLEGANFHYGTPVNPRNAAWLSGGSSSGSAVAVASGQCDFALGTDTGGSVRVPAAFCGIFGFRPSHGTIPLDGVLPFAPGYDTVGWFAREAGPLRAVGKAFLPDGSGDRITAIRLVDDVPTRLDPTIAASFRRAASALGASEPLVLFDEITLDELSRAYQIIQGYEIAEALGARIGEVRPSFGPSIAARFAGTKHIGPQDHERACVTRRRFAKLLEEKCPPDTALMLPVTPRPFLPRDADGAMLDEFYQIALGLNSVAGHTGSPQVQMGLPCESDVIGVSLVARRGCDAALLDLACKLRH